MALKKIFEPIRLGNLEIKNRVARTGHGESLGAHYMSDESVAYHLARAQGGCGLTIFGGVAVDVSTMGYGVLEDDAVIPRFKKLVATIEPHGMRVFQQLWHGGQHYLDSRGRPPLAPSAVPSPSPFSTVPIVGVPMDKQELQRIVRGYAAAARRCLQGGLHGVEINAAHSYLPHQFLSPITNTRTDEYGGSLENRMRFLLEVYAAIRAEVGTELVIGCRLGADERHWGPTEAELNTVALRLESLGIDYFSAGLGDYGSLERMVGAMQEPTGYQIPSARRVFEGTRVPKIIAGRFRTLEEGEQVLREGEFQLIGMVRALIADPHLVRKTVEEGAERVRPCIACNQGCIGGLLRGEGMHCTVNAAAGYELQYSEDLLTRVHTPKKVIVVGGGPAGLEAARIAALRGHRVSLHEASPKLGGAVNVAAKAAQQTTLSDIVFWLEAEIYRLGVDVQLSSYLEADDIVAQSPDAVILATGSSPRMDGQQVAAPDRPASGVGLPHVLSSIDLIMTPPKNLGKSAVVLDTVGHFEGVVCAVQLVQLGLAVTYVTHLRTFAPYVHSTDRDDSMLKMLHAGDFTLVIDHVLVDIAPGQCTIRPALGKKLQTVAADVVVLVTPNESNRSLYDELQGRVRHVALVGDALSPRDIQVAIREGHREARGIA